MNGRKAVKQSICCARYLYLLGFTNYKQFLDRRRRLFIGTLVTLTLDCQALTASSVQRRYWIPPKMP